MSTAKRRKRAKRRRNAKWRKWSRKILRNRRRELQHSELLSQFQSYIDTTYQRGAITLFRWAHDPFTGDDFRPQIFQSFSDRDISEVKVPSPAGSLKKIEMYVNYFTLSHFLSVDQAATAYKEQIEKLRGSDHPERIEDFIQNKGCYVQKCNYEEDDILYGEGSPTGHINVLPCVGLDPTRVIDTTFTPLNMILDL